MMTDPIADMLTRIRNAMMVFQKQTEIPKSTLKVEIARILKQEGYIEDYSIDDEFPAKIVVKLKYYGPRRSRRPVISGIDRVSKPGRRVYVGKDDVPWVMSGMGIAILSTSNGVMTGQEARRKGIGGEVLCYVK
jgi:small subunit ribosomal protein S8